MIVDRMSQNTDGLAEAERMGLAGVADAVYSLWHD